MVIKIVKFLGKFMQYDYGSSTNIKVYNSTTPPEYPLDQVSLPVAIYYGTNDYLTMQPVRKFYNATKQIFSKFYSHSFL